MGYEERKPLAEKIKAEGEGAGIKWETIATAAMANHPAARAEAERMLGHKITSLLDLYDLQSAARMAMSYGEQLQADAVAVQDANAGVCSASKAADNYMANPLANARRAAKLTQKQLAEATQIPVTLIRKLENGTRDMLRVNVDYAMRIATALNMTVEQLFGEKQDGTS